jgi:hypothetical protein
MKVFLLWRIDYLDHRDHLVDVYENKDNAERARDILTYEWEKENPDDADWITDFVVYDYDVLTSIGREYTPKTSKEINDGKR